MAALVTDSTRIEPMTNLPTASERLERLRALHAELADLITSEEAVIYPVLVHLGDLCSDLAIEALSEVAA
jgi:hypothetical protein